MARYPIKMLKDENNNPFVPLVSTECVKDPGGQSLDQKLADKLEASNILAGDNTISISTSGNNVSITANLTAALENLVKQYILASHPVGSIEINISGANPSTYLGGTWEQIKDVFLLSAGDTYTAGSTGGEAMHTLTIGEMPPHNHQCRTYSGKDWNEKQWTFKSIYNSAEGSIGSDAAGGGQPHNNMPPYLVVYVWKRTA